MWWWVISHFYYFCCFWFVAVIIVDKQQKVTPYSVMVIVDGATDTSTYTHFSGRARVYTLSIALFNTSTPTWNIRTLVYYKITYSKRTWAIKTDEIQHRLRRHHYRIITPSSLLWCLIIPFLSSKFPSSLHHPFLSFTPHYPAPSQGCLSTITSCSDYLLTLLMTPFTSRPFWRL